MSFIPVDATSKNWKLRFYKKTASIAIGQNVLLDWPASVTGYFVVATSSTTKLCGISQFITTSADSDYASNTLKPVLVPIGGPASEVWATTAGTAVATDVGGRYDLTDSTTVNRAASTVGRYVMTGFVSATKTKGYLLPLAIYGAAA